MLDPMLPASFYARPAPELAVALLGCRFVRRIGEHWVGGAITETEAYTQDDEASHSFRGPTARNAAMFQKAGTIYVYRSYGMHFCLNISSGHEGQGEGVLIRSIQPLWGLDIMRQLRRWPEPKPWQGLCNGPGKLTQAMAIDLSFNGVPLDQCRDLKLSQSPEPVQQFRSGPRVGISKNVERPWRFQTSTDL